MHETMLQYSHKYHAPLSYPQTECHKRHEYCNSITTEFVHSLAHPECKDSISHIPAIGIAGPLSTYIYNNHQAGPSLYTRNTWKNIYNV